MKIKDGFVVREVCAHKVLVAEGAGTVDFNKLLTLNNTAEFLWNTAVSQGNFTVESLATALCNEYNVDKATATKDVETLVAQWKNLAIVE